MMKRTPSLIFALLLVLTMIGCNHLADYDNPVTDQSDNENQTAISPPVTSPPPQVTSPALSSSAPGEQDSSPSSKAESDQGSSQQENANPPTAPAINKHNLYSDDPYAATSIWDNQLDLNFSLTGDVAQEFFRGISFEGFTSLAESYQMEVNSSNGPCIQFIASDFTAILKLEKDLGVAMYQLKSGEIYYYSIPSGAFDQLHDYIKPYADVYYESPGELDVDDDGNINY